MGLATLTLLFVEDHQPLAKNLAEFFDREPYITDFAGDGLTALHLLATKRYDVVVLDVLLPGVNGFTICKQVREQLQSNTPILMLTALDSIEDKTKGFGAGADDYLAKPFDMRELELRIQSLARRNQGSESHLVAGEVSYYPGTLTVKLADSSVVLSGYSATLFEVLIRAFPNFVSYAELGKAIWGKDDGDEHTIRTHAYSLRKQLKQHLGRTLIKSIYGRGYQLDPSAE